MADFYDRRNIAAVTDFADPNAKFEFGFEAPEQLVFNESTVVLEASFDGVNVHARLNATGPSAVIHWSDHKRLRVYVRRAVAGGGTVYAQVMATTV